MLGVTAQRSDPGCRVQQRAAGPQPVEAAAGDLRRLPFAAQVGHQHAVVAGRAGRRHQIIENTEGIEGIGDVHRRGRRVRRELAGQPSQPDRQHPAADQMSVLGEEPDGVVDVDWGAASGPAVGVQGGGPAQGAQPGTAVQRPAADDAGLVDEPSDRWRYPVTQQLALAPQRRDPVVAGQHRPDLHPQPLPLGFRPGELRLLDQPPQIDVVTLVQRRRVPQSGPDRAGRGGRVVAPVASRPGAADDAGPTQVELGQHDLVLEHPGELVDEAPDLAQRLGPNGETAHRRGEHAPLEHQLQHRRGRDHRAGRPGQRGVDVDVLAEPPAVPEQCPAADQFGLRVGPQQPEFVLEMAGQPDVVGVEEGDHLGPGGGQPEVAGGAHPPVPVAGMFQVADAAGLIGGPPAGKVRGRRGRTVVAEQQFDPGLGLVEHTADRFVEEGRRRVEEDHQHRNRGPGPARLHPLSVPEREGPRGRFGDELCRLVSRFGVLLRTGRDRQVPSTSSRSNPTTSSNWP